MPSFETILHPVTFDMSNWTIIVTNVVVECLLHSDILERKRYKFFRDENALQLMKPLFEQDTCYDIQLIDTVDDQSFLQMAIDCNAVKWLKTLLPAQKIPKINFCVREDCVCADDKCLRVDVSRVSAAVVDILCSHFIEFHTDTLDCLHSPVWQSLLGCMVSCSSVGNLMSETIKIGTIEQVEHLISLMNTKWPDGWFDTSMFLTAYLDNVPVLELLLSLPVKIRRPSLEASEQIIPIRAHACIEWIKYIDWQLNYFSLHLIFEDPEVKHRLSHAMMDLTHSPRFQACLNDEDKTSDLFYRMSWKQLHEFFQDSLKWYYLHRVAPLIGSRLFGDAALIVVDFCVGPSISKKRAICCT
jgi:hypothetical protein